MLTKEKLRAELRTQRQALSIEEQHQAAEKIKVQLINSSVFQDNQRIAFYSATRGEIDPFLLLQEALRQNKSCYLPTLDPKEINKICFINFMPNDLLQINRYGISEPIYNEEKLCQPLELDLVLVPTVGFDAKGNRIGSGAGYYDRTFEFLNVDKNLKKPFLLGLAYEFQFVEKIISNDWDVKLNGVLTEKHLRIFT